MASLFTTVLEQVGQLHKADDDLVDRLNHRFTVILLITFTAFISAKQFIGEPISCWAPAQFSGPQIAYTNSICWLKGTYYLANNQQSIPNRKENTEFRIAYYQYVPYILIVMAVLFYLPHMLWRNMSRHIGFDLRLLIQNVRKASENDIYQVAEQIHIALEYNSSKDIINRNKTLMNLFKIFQWQRQYRYHLSLLYIFVKILYLTNCLCQFYFLNIFLSFPFYKFGYDWLLITLKKVHNKTNDELDELKWFPRNVMCDFMVRQLGSNQHWYTIQCNLPINLFNEIIFLIIWAWFIFLSSLTCLSFIICIISMCINIDHTFIYKYLHRNSLKLINEKQDRFIENYLKWDGILILRIIAHNTNHTIMIDLVQALFEIYLDSIENENNHHHDQIQSNEHCKFSNGTSI